MTRAPASQVQTGDCETPLTDYEQAKSLARDRDPAVRRSLARRTDVRPEILYFLAADETDEVRREIAGNTATPVQADLLLAADRDEAVRCSIARKVSNFAPYLSPEETGRLGAVVVETLNVLAADRLVEVRRILAEELKSAGNVDPAIIARLARDGADDVALPVLEHSPLLSDDLLIEIIESGAVQTRLAAIARRAGLPGGVADALVATENDPAIAVLLANRSAQIREETLDALIDQGMGKPDWHKPLVDRPRLSLHGIRTLTEYVAGPLLAHLLERRDIDADTAALLSAKLQERIGETEAADETMPDRRAAALNRQNRLVEGVVSQAAIAGDREFTIAALCEKSGLSIAMVRKIALLDDGAGVAAVVWKAGFSMALAELLQEKLLRIAPATVLRAAADGGYPMSDQELEWRLELFEDA